VLCTYLFTSELIAANPMAQVGRPRVPKALPKALPANTVSALLTTLSAEPNQRRSDWVERDRALILTSLLAGLRSDELIRANVGDIRPAAEGAVIQVRGKGGKDRRIPIEATMLQVLTSYLDSRAVRFPNTTKKRSPTADSLAGRRRLPCSSALMVRVSREERCNTASYAPSAMQVSTPNARSRRTSLRPTAHLRH
jgi:site-specific recombinase XerD